MTEINLNTQRLRKTLYNDSDTDNESENLKVDKNKKGGNFNHIKRFIPKTGFFIFLIFLLQAVQLYFFINPINLISQLDAVQVVNDISKKVAVPASEIPIVGVIGDNKVLPDIDTLKKQNEVNARVYANAQNGDYVFGYSSKMVIYRKTTGQIVYEGLSPVSIVTNTENGIVTNIVNKVKEQKLIAADSGQIPQVSVVSDVTSLQNTDRSFYANVQKDDLVGVFTSSNLIVIYRPSTNTIINSGKVQTSITK